jgi:hypothetical protein
MKFKRKVVTRLTQQRIDFIFLLNTTFIVKKGYGACASISITDGMTLFEKYLDSNEPTRSLSENRNRRGRKPF